MKGRIEPTSVLIRVAILLPALLAVVAAAQKISVRPGTEIPVELRTRLDTDSVKVGSRVEFHTIEAVLIGHNIVVPSGAVIAGRVEEVISRGTASPNSLARISINSLKWKSGEAPLNAVVIGVEPSPAEQMLSLGRRSRTRNPPIFLKDIHIRAHLKRRAATEFYSDHPNFTVDKGLYFLLRQVDPDHDPAMMGRDHTLDVGPED